MIKAAIFDMDGVLLDSMHIWDDLGAEYLRGIGIEPREDLSEKLAPMSMEQGAEYMKESYNLQEDTSEISKAIAKMLERFYFEEVNAKPGAANLLDELKARNIRMAVVTSSPKEHAARALERLGLLPYFEFILTSEEVGSSKHDPLIYHRAAENLSALPSETMVFEDALYAIETAANAGFCTIGVYDKSSGSDAERIKEICDHYVMELLESKEFMFIE